MEMLAAHLEEENRREAREIYIGNALWMIATAGRKNCKLQPLSDIMHEDMVRDTRTGAEIVASVLERLKM